MNVFAQLLNTISEKGAAYVVLIDPDNKNDTIIESNVALANQSGVDALFVGGSLIMDGCYVDRVKRIKDSAQIPVIFFPGGIGQLNSYYDAMLFMSIISGRNPHYLIGEQVIAAPSVKDLGIETIATGYMILDGGAGSTVEFMSGTRPIPMNRPDIAVAHALAGQYLGMELIYLEAGSGAKKPVEIDIIKYIHQAVNIPLIVGGGIRTPTAAAERVEAGAAIIVTGTVTERNSLLMKEFSKAIHWKIS
tara:strand:- start:360 stop:1103 length:744 start_codon:yes stop_codon:yes gene_type:complete